MSDQYCKDNHEGKPVERECMGGRGWVVLVDICVPSPILKKPKWINCNHFLEREKSGTTQTRKRKT
jgi:hypothetical protein